jgi:hypothetical protein
MLVRAVLAFLAGGLLSACDQEAGGPGLSDDTVDNLVRRSYQYVAMYNVNNKFALKQGGWNTIDIDTKLKDHTMREIARPNNDSLYISALLDLREDAVVLKIPAIESTYVSLMITGYDHYVNIPIATRLGDFKKPETLLIYAPRTRGYDGQKIEGIDRTFEATCAFVSAVFRVMPHASEAKRFAKITEQMKEVSIETLAEFQGGEAKPLDKAAFPAVGEKDADIFENNLLEVMQFVLNHTTLDPDNELDQALLAAYEPYGVVPGQAFDAEKVEKLDGKRIRKAAEAIRAEQMAMLGTPKGEAIALQFFKPKGQMKLEGLLLQSVIGPIGQPAEEAVYPSIGTADGAPMTAQHDYVVRMTADQMPPAQAFWSFTLYDTENGFFLPNPQKKYSVGDNAGMKLDEKGGIEIYVAAEKPEGVPEENWLPVERGDYAIDLILRVYVPDLEKYKTWKAPLAERLKGAAQ